MSQSQHNTSFADFLNQEESICLQNQEFYCRKNRVFHALSLLERQAAFEDMVNDARVSGEEIHPLFDDPDFADTYLELVSEMVDSKDSMQTSSNVIL